MMTAAVAAVPPERAHDASGIMSTALQVSYAVGLTAMGSLFLGSSHGAHAGGHGFMVVSLALAGLALAAAGLAWLTGRPGVARAGSRSGRGSVMARDERVERPHELGRVVAMREVAGVLEDR
jgi:hypothetical protein